MLAATDVPRGQLYNLVSKLNDANEVKRKPQISKKADEILRQKQEGAYKWLYQRVAGAADAKVSYATFKFDLVPPETLECFMPLLIKLRDLHEKAAEAEDETAPSPSVDETWFVA